MFEIWRHVETGARYLVVNRGGRVNVAAGPLAEHDDPRVVLQWHTNQNRNPWALLDMRRRPQDYEREYTKDKHGQVVQLSQQAPSDD